MGQPNVQAFYEDEENEEENEWYDVEVEEKNEDGTYKVNFLEYEEVMDVNVNNLRIKEDEESVSYIVKLPFNCLKNILLSRKICQKLD